MTNFFRNRRDELKKSQLQIAIAAGLTPATISFYETGRALPRMNLYERLAQAYEVPVERIAQEVLAMHRRTKLVAVPA